MQDNQLQKAIDLTKKTGDRLIVFETAGSKSPYVVMGLDDYEKLIIGKNEVRGLTENELLDKINRDVAVWKSDNEYEEEQTENHGKNKDFINDFFDFNDDDEDDYCEEDNEYEDEIEDIYKEDFSSPGLKDMRKSFSKRGNGSKSGWSIPSDRKKAADEVVEEDRQYLEELPF